MCVCVCVLTGVWNQAVWKNYEVVGFQASVSDCLIPRLCRFLRLHFYSSPSAPQFILPFLDHPFRFFIHPNLSSIAPHNFFPPMQLLYLFSPASTPPLSPGHGDTVYLDGSPAHRPPPLICASLSCQADQRRYSHKLRMPSPVRFPSFPSSTCAQVPVGPMVIPSRVHFLPMPASINLTPTPPPCRPWLADQSIIYSN